MRVMLLSLPGSDYHYENEYQFPLGVGYLVSYLKNMHDVKAYHYSNYESAIQDIHTNLVQYKPNLVSLSCNTFNRGHVRDVIGKIREYNCDITIVVGGVHASFCFEQVLINYGADIVVIGDGETTLLNLCNILEEGKPINSVNGIAYKLNNKVVVTEPGDIVYDLDKLPMPDYSYAKTYIEKAKTGYVITSRGCPVRCTFCSTSSFWGQAIRMHSVKRVVDDIEMLTATYGITRIYFYDDTFNLSVDRVKLICKEIIDRKININWSCSCRVKPVSEEMVAAMVDAGCRHICWGIESGSEEILKNINKKITLADIRNAFEISNKFCNIMSTGCFTMVGNPGETTSSIKDTIELLNSISLTDQPTPSILYILPGTLLYESLLNRGHINEEGWYKTDDVPYYTLENSLYKLKKWANKISQSGNIIPFDNNKHIRHYPESNCKHRKMTFKIYKVIGHPKIFIDRIMSYFSGRIRF